MDMKYEIKFLPAANQNLLDIDNYLSKFYPSTALNFFSELDKKISNLQDMPYIGTVYAPNPKYRRLVIGDYLMFYVVKENTCIVEIHRVLNGSQNIKPFSH